MGEEEEDLPAELPSPELTAAPRRRRPFCEGCRRAASVCLCALIPSPPITTTTTHIFILQHPHERRHRLATLPVLSACISAVTTAVGRRLRPGLSPLLDSISLPPSLSLYLFPPTFHSPALPLSLLPSSSSSSVLLILFDATWNHAAEMVAASQPFLTSISAVRVSLHGGDGGGDGGGGGGSIYDSELILRKEPRRGYVSTMEAVAEAMAVLEPDGIRIRFTLLKVLKAMVRFQASNLEKKSLKPGDPN